jgi:hypothetical protein
MAHRFCLGENAMKNMTILTMMSLLIYSSSHLYADEVKKEESTAVPRKFDLFNDDRGIEKKPEPPPMTPPPIQQPIPTPPPIPPKKIMPQRDFILRGTSRFGEKYIAVLQSPTGAEFYQSWSAEEPNKPIEFAGFGNYTLVKVEPRKVSIHYPDDAPCQNNNPMIGIKCEKDEKGASIAVLTLERRQALAAPPPLPPPQPVQNPMAAVQPQPINSPMEAEQQQQPGQQLPPSQPFKRRVIRDEDVPPGMRVVRTPFGDRLVPDNKPLSEQQPNAFPVR